MTPDLFSAMAEKIVGEDDGNKYHQAKIRLIANALREAEQRGLERAEKAIPTTWLDSILSGPDAVDGKPTDGCPYVEAVLKRIKERIAAEIRKLKGER